VEKTCCECGKTVCADCVQPAGEDTSDVVCETCLEGEAAKEKMGAEVADSVFQFASALVRAQVRGAL
jgi:hypothetical protein